MTAPQKRVGFLPHSQSETEISLNADRKTCVQRSGLNTLIIQEWVVVGKRREPTGPLICLLCS